MKDKITILAPAKINIFLKVLGRRRDGLHVLRTGMNYINLYDKIEIKKNNKNHVIYQGKFKPVNNIYDDCIILKTLDFLKLKNQKFKITITKNIPVKGGLGSASTNAAALIKGLHKMGVIQAKSPSEYISLGSDIPFFLIEKNCLVTGVGEILKPKKFPKYYFILIKPNFENSTKEIYKELKFSINSFKKYQNTKKSKDIGNDFEKIIFKKKPQIKNIIKTLDSLDHVVFTRMSGTGSCFFSAFKSKGNANKAFKILNLKYKNLWTYICENNIINQ